MNIRFTVFASIFALICCCAGGAVAQNGPSLHANPQTKDILAEALHQAIGLEKLPDLNHVLGRDSIFIEAFEQSANGDGSFEAINEAFIPMHVDKWMMVPMTSGDLRMKLIPQKLYHIKASLSRQDEYYVVNLICEPYFDARSDRGRLTLYFQYDNGLFLLKRLVKWYG
jgi:hypothetical protein